MLKEILRFEFEYRKKRAATYIYFGIIFLLCFLAVASPIVRIGGAMGQIKANAPYIIANMTLIMSFAMVMITSAIMGVSIVRDFDHNTEAILFSTPLKKLDYLLGRFGGSFIVLIFVFSGIWLGFMFGFSIGKVLPWEVPWKEKEILPFDAWHYFQPFFLFTLTNIFISGSLFFMAGALSRKTLVIYTQGIALLVLYEMANSLLGKMEYQYLAALLDPFGIHTFEYVTRYWTPAERNTLLVPFEGVVLYNRLIWMGVGVLSLVITYYGFSFNVVRKSWFGNKKAITTKEVARTTVTIPEVKQVINLGTSIQQLIQLSIFNFKLVFKEIPFLAIVFCGILLLFTDSVYMGEMYGTSSYPTTFAVLELIDGFNLFFLIIIVFYSGELIWKERDVKINLIIDAMPMPSFVSMLSKFIGLVLVYIALLLVLILCGVIVQSAYGYFNFELSVYFKSLFSDTLAFLVLYTLLALFIQVLTNHKFLGFTLVIVFFIFRSFLGEMGFEHGLWQFGSGGLGTLSAMNNYGHFVTPFSWYKLYWFGFTALLFVFAVVLSARGSESLMKMRWKSGKLRLTKAMTTFLLTTILLFVGTGAYIYYNTRVLNTFTNSDDREKDQAEYERTYKKYEFIPQPKIVEANLKVDIYPYSRDFVAEGYYYLKNKTEGPISEIHIQQSPDRQITIESLTFNRDATITLADEKFRYFIYELKEPLASHDSVKVDFKINFTTTGFENSGSNTDVVYNGTFFNNMYFPSLGYNEGAELSNDDDRKKQKLEEKERMLERDDPRGLAMSLFGDDADHIRYEMVVSTEPDQIAISPGYLQREWTENDRRYFHYKMDAPMCNFYNIVSAKYEVARDKWNDVNLEVYYNKGHEYNVERMVEGMKDALDYFTTNFSPFQFKQLRIMEFPRYSSFAQSFANTIPFSEGIGFILKIDNPDEDLDMAYYVTAHEVAHQWWGHQVMEAGVKGNAMLSESMSQYSALMVLKKEFPQERIEQFLKYELNSYLRGRTTEIKKEQPLALVEGQGYIHYRKASLIFYALQDYISEDSVNAAFKRFNQKWAFKDAPYPTSEDLLIEIRKVTPDSMQYLIKDMFETITLFENKTESAVYEKKGDQFEVTLNVKSEKLRADSTGMETTIPISDWIDIGVYTKGEDGKDKLVYLQKHKIDKEENTFVINVSKEPSRAGIDPIHKLIDRHADDNTKAVEKKE